MRFLDWELEVGVGLATKIPVPDADRPQRHALAGQRGHVGVLDEFRKVVLQIVLVAEHLPPLVFQVAIYGHLWGALEWVHHVSEVRLGGVVQQRRAKHLGGRVK